MTYSMTYSMTYFVLGVYVGLRRLEPGEVKSLKYHACAQNQTNWKSPTDSADTMLKDVYSGMLGCVKILKENS